jgi:hypothetical protein
MCRADAHVAPGLGDPISDAYVPAELWYNAFATLASNARTHDLELRKFLWRLGLRKFLWRQFAAFIQRRAGAARSTSQTRVRPIRFPVTNGRNRTNCSRAPNT